MTKNVHTLDVQVLDEYLKSEIDDFKGILESKKFNTGQSNPTYLLNSGEKKYVLRKKPPGKLLPSAHAVDREYRVMKALSNSSVPVPKMLHLCEDDSIIGTIFYLMEFVEGRIFWDPTLPEVNKEQRREIYEETNRTLAALHQIDIKKLNLETFGKPGNYFERQVNRWIQQYRAAETSPYKEVESLIIWLEKNMPKDDGMVSIVHGDYRLYNMIFDPKETQILAVLDWELSTLGHPYADLAYQCMSWYVPKIGITPGLLDADTITLGIPSEEEYVKSYCQKMGISSIPNWSFYLAFGFFRLAGIAQGVYKRSLQGNASADNAKDIGAIVPILGKIAMSIIHKNN